MKGIIALVFVFAASANAAQSCPGLGNSDRPQFQRPADGVVVSGFGYRRHPLLHQTRMHTGVDYGLALGDLVRASASGKVLFAGPEPGYGNHITLDHGGGYETSYAHLSAIDVRAGDCLRAGDIIGKSGESGGGPRLHFEVRINSRFVNPLRYVADNNPQ